MGLPVVKRRYHANDLLPSKEALLKCFAIASTPEAAEYLLTQFESILKKTNKLKEAASLHDKMKEFVKTVIFQRGSRTSPWSGNTDIKTDFENLQQHLAESAFETLKAKNINQVRMDFAVGPDSELLRAFTINEKMIDKSVSPAMNTMFNAFLAQFNLLSKGGAIFQANNQGEIINDADGQPIKALPEHIKKIISAELKKYAHEHGVELIVNQQNYPQKTAVAAKSIEAPVSQPSPSTATTQKEYNDNEAPTTPASGGLGS